MKARGGMTTGVALLILVTGACGGSAGETDVPNTNAQGETPIESAESSPSTAVVEQSEAAPSTIAKTGSNTSNSDHPRTDVSHATVVVGEEVLRFAQVGEKGSGTCDPEYFGIQFRAILARIDDQGQAIETGATGDFAGSPSVTFGFTNVGPEEGVIGMIGGWVASTAEGRGSVDSVTIDGNTAWGTATFVDETGENPVEGTFEVVCVG